MKPSRPRTRLKIGLITDPGIKRQNEANQDALGVVLPNFFNQRPPLLIIADGMGGYEGGKFASKFVVDTIAQAYRKSKKGQDPSKLLVSCIQAAHHKIRSVATKNARLAKMGSTVVTVVWDDSKLYVANVGDSRAYRINSNEIQLLSQDQSFVGDLLRQGLISPEEAKNHPKRNILSMSISPLRPEISINTAVYEIGPEDVIVLCSDGLWNPVTENQIQNVVTALPPDQAVKKLVEMANMNQGPDNISVIVACLENKPGEKPRAAGSAELDDTNPGRKFQEEKTVNEPPAS